MHKILRNLLGRDARNPAEERHAGTVFQGFWHGPALGPLRQACLASFAANGHTFRLFTYEPFDVPAGISVCDAGSVIPRSQLFRFRNPITGKDDIGPFSDLFRFKLLSNRGGWWSDVDTICLSSAIPEVDRAWARELPEFHPTAVGSSQIAFKKNDPVVRNLYETCLKLSRTDFDREDLGPKLISRIIQESGLPLDQFGTTDTFYPLRWIEMFMLWLPDYAQAVEDRASRALFMPIYQSFIQYIGLSAGILPPSGSYLDMLCKKAGYSDGARYEPLEVRSAVRAFFARTDWARSELIAVRGEASARSVFEM